MKLAAIVVAVSCAAAARVEAQGFKLVGHPPYDPIAVAFAADGKAEGLARALDGMSLGSLAGGNEGFVITGSSLRTSLHQPLSTVSGALISPTPVAGDVDDAAWLALAQLEQAVGPRHARVLVIVGHLDGQHRDRLLARAEADGILVREYADAAALAAVDRPWGHHPRQRDLAPPPAPELPQPPVVGACSDAPRHRGDPLPAWPAFALLALAGALALRASRAPRAL